MPASIRPDDKSKKIAYDILGAPKEGYTDSKGTKKKYNRKKRIKKTSTDVIENS